MKEDIGPGPVIQTYPYQVMLQAGEWRKQFSEEQYKLIVAMALNDCSAINKNESGWFELTGYLLTGSRVYILCRTWIKDLQPVLDYFYERVYLHLVMVLESSDDTAPWPAAKDSIPVIPMEEFRLFTQHHLYSGWLIALLTGHEVKLGYYDPQLERLKKMLQNERYCSLINYQGGIGPVFVKAGHFPEY